MGTKLTKLTPALVEKTCDKCGGLIRLHQECDDGVHVFRKTKYWYEYKCDKCGDIIKSDFPLVLREIIFIDEENNTKYDLVSMNGLYIQA